MTCQNVSPLPRYAFAISAIYGTPIAYRTASPASMASAVPQKVRGRFASFPITNADGISPSRNPNVGCKTYENPPPSAKIGTPTSPISTYTACDSAP